MKLRCQNERIQKTLLFSERFTAKHVTLPILESLYLRAEDGRLSISATNLNTGIELSIPAKIEQSGICTIPGSMLAAYIQAIPSTGVLDIYFEDDVCVFETGGFKARFKKTLEKDFPQIPFPKEGDILTCTISSSILVQGLRNTLFAVAISDIRPEMASIYMYTREKSLYFVATDMYRLAEKVITLQDPIGDISMLIPAKNLPDILRVISAYEEDIILSFTKTQLVITGKEYQILIRLVEATFPDYTQIVPKESTTEVLVLKSDIVQALKIVSPFLDKFFHVQISLNKDEKKLILDSKETYAGDSHIFLDALVSGEDISIACNGKSFQDCLPFISDDSLKMSFTVPTRPIKVTSAHDTTFMYLIMPNR
jgi:DNA polymerase III subunit beta